MTKNDLMSARSMTGNMVCTILHCTVLYCTVLYLSVQYNTIMYSHTVLSEYLIVGQYSIVLYCTVHLSTVLCNTVQDKSCYLSYSWHSINHCLSFDLFSDKLYGCFCNLLEVLGLMAPSCRTFVGLTTTRVL